MLVFPLKAAAIDRYADGTWVYLTKTHRASLKSF